MEPMNTHDSPNHDHQRCIEACMECHAVCEHMIYQHCLPRGGAHVAPEHLKLMADCAQICRVAADFMIRGSAHHALTCGVCANLCAACADDCERVGDMEECVRACRACAEACREMAEAHADAR
jgi:hypothetical protein